MNDMAAGSRTSSTPALGSLCLFKDCTLYILEVRQVQEREYRSAPVLTCETSGEIVVQLLVRLVLRDQIVRFLRHAFDSRLEL